MSEIKDLSMMVSDGSQWIDFTVTSHQLVGVRARAADFTTSEVMLGVNNPDHVVFLTEWSAQMHDPKTGAVRSSDAYKRQVRFLGRVDGVLQILGSGYGAFPVGYFSRGGTPVSPEMVAEDAMNDNRTLLPLRVAVSLDRVDAFAATPRSKEAPVHPLTEDEWCVINTLYLAGFSSWKDLRLSLRSDIPCDEDFDLALDSLVCQRMIRKTGNGYALTEIGKGARKANAASEDSEDLTKAPDVSTSVELQIIRDYYGEGCADRSKVPLINHIHEGLEILDHIGASDFAKRAYCLHPLVQDDGDFRKNLPFLDDVTGRVAALAVEYRRVANAYLSHREIDSISDIELSPLKDVNDMLIADKVQNYRDFRAYHFGTHPRSAELEQYFRNWFWRLGVDQNGDRLRPGGD